MKVKKIIIGITKEDLMNFLKIQKKITFKDVTINENLILRGEFNFLALKMNFEAILHFSKVVSNNVYIKVDGFKILNLNVLNSVVKKAFNYVFNAFNDLEGITFQGDEFKIVIPKLINRYYNQQDILDLNKVEVTRVLTTTNEIEVTFGGIEINSEIIKDEITNDIPYIQAEIVYNKQNS